MRADASKYECDSHLGLAPGESGGLDFLGRCGFVVMSDSVLQNGFFWLWSRFRHWGQRKAKEQVIQHVPAANEDPKRVKKRLYACIVDTRLALSVQLRTFWEMCNFVQLCATKLHEVAQSCTQFFAGIFGCQGRFPHLILTFLQKVSETEYFSCSQKLQNALKTSRSWNYFSRKVNPRIRASRGYHFCMQKKSEI